MEKFGKVCFLVAILFISVIWNGYVFSIVWGWFVSDYFGIKELSIPAAIGVCLIFNYIKMDYKRMYIEKDIDLPTTERVVYSVATPVVMLLLAWVVTLFM